MQRWLRFKTRLSNQGSPSSVQLGPLLVAMVTAGFLSVESTGMVELSAISSLMDATFNKKWLIRSLFISALPVALLLLRINNEKNNRKSVMEAAQTLCNEGREISSASVSRSTGMPERTVQVYLPAVAVVLQARTSWYKEGNNRHQRLDLLTDRGSLT